MVLRFAIGNPPAELELEIQQEEDASGPFLRIPGKARLLSGVSLAQECARRRMSRAPVQVQDTYKTLTFKTVAFWEVVAQHFSVQYVIKVDDDSYVRLDRLAIAIGQWQAMGAGAPQWDLAVSSRMLSSAAAESVNGLQNTSVASRSGTTARAACGCARTAGMTRTISCLRATPAITRRGPSTCCRAQLSGALCARA